MEFGLLGPLYVRDRDRVVTIAAAKQRVVLAALLLRAGGIVSTDELTDCLWGDDAPSGALITLRNHVMRLRRTLGPAPAARIRTQAPGYVIDLHGPEELDLLAFRSRYERGLRAGAAGQWQAAAQDLESALSLWRGDPLADVPSDLLHAEHRNQLELLRLDALQARVEAELQQGRHQQLLPELRALVDRNPLREGLRRLLMLSLHRAGRRGEALAEYREGRRILAEELGVEPSAELSALHEQILRADPGLDRTAEADAAEAPAAVPPRRSNLPRDLPDFTGRHEEVDQLLVESSSAATRVVAVDGMPGVGKTALAVHTAHRLADRFPDGRLFLDLHGYTAGREPLSPAEALTRLLAALGLPQESIPEDPEEAAALWRAETVDLALLVVLDNASDAEQVRPLLPGGPRCTVLVTSRRRLLDLDGVENLSLDVLPDEDAVQLFRRVAGNRHSSATTEQVLEAMELCGRLPLAIRVAAARLRSRPAWDVPELSRRLRDHSGRTAADSAADADPHGAAAAFTVSYDQLDPPTARVFRLLGLLPGGDFDLDGAAALAGESAAAVESALEFLLDCHLVQQYRAGRFLQHDLLRLHARQTALREEPDSALVAAVDRLFHHYRYQCHRAMELVAPDERDRRPAIPAPSWRRPQDQVHADRSAAIAWLDLERPNLVATVGDPRFPQHAVLVSELLTRYLERGGHRQEAMAVHTAALVAARQLADPIAEAKALRCLGITHLHARRFPTALECLDAAGQLLRQHGQGQALAAVLMNIGIVHGMTDRHDQALAHFQEAGKLSAAVGDGNQEARALANTGVILRRLGRYQEATGHLRRALNLHQEHGNRVGESMVHDNLGVLCRRQGLLDEALEHHREALAIDRACNDRGAEVISLDNLGLVHERRGELDQAMDLFEQALGLARELDDQVAEAIALCNIGTVHLRRGEAAEALAHQHRAVALARALDHQELLAQFCNSLGQSLRRSGDADGAVQQHGEALKLAELIRDPHEAARADEGLYLAHRQAGLAAEARAHGIRALAAFRGLGLPEAERLGQALDA